MKYKLIQKVNPNRRDDPPQWYATPITGESEGADATTRAATTTTGWWVSTQTTSLRPPTPTTGR